MTSADVEEVYEALAHALDAVPAGSRELVLAKLALLLAHEVGDAARVRQLIGSALADLPDAG